MTKNLNKSEIDELKEILRSHMDKIGTYSRRVGIVTGRVTQHVHVLMAHLFPDLVVHMQYSLAQPTIEMILAQLSEFSGDVADMGEVVAELGVEYQNILGSIGEFGEKIETDTES
jgi:hypothetical protein